jgi:hypothetical protein
MKSPLVILLAEDNPGDVFLVREALREHRLEFELFVAENGDKVAALLERVGKKRSATGRPASRPEPARHRREAAISTGARAPAMRERAYRRGHFLGLAQGSRLDQ